WPSGSSRVRSALPSTARRPGDSALRVSPSAQSGTGRLRLTAAAARDHHHHMDPVVIEVAVNGVTRKERNPAVPVAPEEVAVDTIQCLDAGATVVHTHPHSFGDGSSPDVTAEKYAAAYRTVMAERPEAILYPTMSGGPTIAAKWDHHRIL